MIPTKKTDDSKPDTDILFLCGACACHYVRRTKTCDKHGPLGDDGMPIKPKK